MQSKTVIGLVITFALGLMLVSCSIAPDLSFVDHIVVERLASDMVTATADIQDKNDIKAIVEACTESAKSGSGNCGYDVVKIIFISNRKQVVLWPAGDGDPYIKLDGEYGRIYQISPSARSQLFLVLKKYGVILEYLS